MVLGALVDTELQVLAKRLVELLEVAFVVINLLEQVHALLETVLVDDLEDLNERRVLRVDDTLDEVEVLGDEVLTVVHDEDAADVELDIVALLLGFEKVEGSTKRK